MMPKTCHLNNAPIIEAVIDVQVERQANLDVSSLASAGKLLGADYMPAEPLNAVQTSFMFDVKEAQMPPTVTHQHQADGFRFCSKDGGYIASFKPNGFSFSRLRKYTEWDDVFAHARVAWNIYIDIAQPQKATRLAVRYINRLILPVTPMVSLEKFLRIPLQLPKDLPVVLNGFLTRAIVVNQPKGISGNILLFTEAPTTEGAASVVFDIDVFTQQAVNIKKDLFPDHFKDLQRMKNEIFFSHLTDETVTLYK